MLNQAVASSESLDYSDPVKTMRESPTGQYPKSGRISTESYKSAGSIPAAQTNQSSLARSSSLRISRKKGMLASGQKSMRDILG